MGPLPLQLGFFLSAVLAFLCVYFLSGKEILYAFIVFGQAHFLIAYFYANKSGKIGRPYLLKFITLAIILWGICSYAFYHVELYPLVIFVALITFVFHYFNDEFKLCGFSVKNKLFGAIAAAFSFAAVFATQIFFVGPAVVYFLGSISIFFAIVFIRQMLSEKSDDKQAKYQSLLFFTFNIILPLWFAINRNIDVYTVSGFIVLFHYIRWYIYYLERFKGPELSFYLDVIFWDHILIVLLFVLYVLSPKSGYLYMMFNPIFFYGWTLIHILLSVRKEDYFVKI